MISATAQYALRSVVYLASCESDYVSRIEIAELTYIPRDYLLKVLNQLDTAGIIESRRGPGGGYRLVREPARITVLDVVAAVDQIPRIDACPLGIAGHLKLCPLHQLLDDASRLVEEAFQKTTIQQLIPSRKRLMSCSFPTKKPAQ